MIKNKDLYRFRQGFDSLYNVEIPADLSLKVIKNLRLINIELEDLEKIVKPSEVFLKEYQPKVEDLAKKYCTKDENGNPLLKQEQNGSKLYTFNDEDKKQFEVDLIELENQEENKELISTRKKQIETFNELLEKESTIELFKVDISLLPKTITPQQIDSIYELIQE